MGIAGRKDDVDNAIHISHGDTVRQERPDKLFTTTAARPSTRSPSSGSGAQASGKRKSGERGAAPCRY